MRSKSGSVAPNAYGDVSKKLNASYKSIISIKIFKENLKVLEPHF